MDNTTANTKSRMNQIADESSNLLHSAADKIADISSRAGSQIKESAQTIATRSKEVAVGAGGYAKQHPVVTAGIVIAVGLLIGKLLKDRNYF